MVKVLLENESKLNKKMLEDKKSLEESARMEKEGITQKLEESLKKSKLFGE